MNCPNPTKPQQFEKKKKKQQVIGKRSISSPSTHQLTLSVRQQGLTYDFGKHLPGGRGVQTWHNFNLTYCLSTCPVIQYNIYHILCHYKCEDSKIHILIQSAKLFYKQIMLAPKASNFQDLVAPWKISKLGASGSVATLVGNHNRL